MLEKSHRPGVQVWAATLTAVPVAIRKATR
jgi:hypothetical protein